MRKCIANHEIHCHKFIQQVLFLSVECVSGIMVINEDKNNSHHLILLFITILI